jgi:hypothetical protein
MDGDERQAYQQENAVVGVKQLPELLLHIGLVRSPGQECFWQVRAT